MSLKFNIKTKKKWNLYKNKEIDIKIYIQNQSKNLSNLKKNKPPKIYWLSK